MVYLVWFGSMEADMKKKEQKTRRIWLDISMTVLWPRSFERNIYCAHVSLFTVHGSSVDLLALVVSMFANNGL